MRSFGEKHFYIFRQEKTQAILSEINSLTKDYLLRVDEAEYFEFLKLKYSLEPIKVYQETESFNEPTKSIETIHSVRGEYEGEVLNFVISYAFTGSATVFGLIPSRRIQTSKEISVNERTSRVSFKFSIHKKDPEEFVKLKSTFYDSAFKNVQNINNDVERWNNSFMNGIPGHFRKLKNKFIEENSFFEAIKLKTSSGTNSIFNVPTV